MLATHSQQSEDVFEENWWMTATPSGYDNSTVASQDERCKGGSTEDGDMVEEVVEKVIKMENEEEEEEGATLPSSFAADIVSVIIQDLTKGGEERGKRGTRCGVNASKVLNPRRLVTKCAQTTTS